MLAAHNYRARVVADAIHLTPVVGGIARSKGGTDSGDPIRLFVILPFFIPLFGDATSGKDSE